MKSTRKGRPAKYTHIIHTLEDDQLYTPATIADHAEAKGFFPQGLDQKGTKAYRKRIRQAMSRVTAKLSEGGDGTVKIPGQEPSRAWLGHHFKEAMRGE